MKLLRIVELNDITGEGITGEISVRQANYSSNIIRHDLNTPVNSARQVISVQF